MDATCGRPAPSAPGPCGAGAAASSMSIACAAHAEAGSAGERPPFLSPVPCGLRDPRKDTVRELPEVGVAREGGDAVGLGVQGPGVFFRPDSSLSGQASLSRAWLAPRLLAGRGRPQGFGS